MITDQDHRIEFQCVHWLKPELLKKFRDNSQLKRMGDLWKDYGSPNDLEKAALVWFAKDNVLEVMIQKIVPENETIPSYGLLVRIIK